jgi:hypothetical protein
MKARDRRITVMTELIGAIQVSHAFICFHQANKIVYQGIYLTCILLVIANISSLLGLINGKRGLKTPERKR